MQTSAVRSAELRLTVVC